VVRATSHFGQLLVSLAVGWLVLAAPAWLCVGHTAVEGLTYAAVLCLLPGLLVSSLSLVPWVRQRPLLPVLAASGARVTVVLGGAAWLAWTRPDLRVETFFLWLGLLYVVALVSETRQLLAAGAAARMRQHTLTGTWAGAGHAAG
jgi:hypothetical protein